MAFIILFKANWFTPVTKYYWSSSVSCVVRRESSVNKFISLTSSLMKTTIKANCYQLYNQSVILEEFKLWNLWLNTLGPHERGQLRKKATFSNKRLTRLNGNLSTIAHTQTCRGVSYLHLMKFHSGIKILNIGIKMTSLLKIFPNGLWNL